MTTPPSTATQQPVGAPSPPRARGAVWALSRLVRNQPVRFTTSLLVWLTIWTMPVALGVITQRFFDGLTDDGGWALSSVVVAIVVWTTAYIAAILTGIRLHASLMVRARTSVQRTMLAWIFGLPAARPVAESSGEVVSRFRDDTEHVQDAFDFTVDFLGSGLSATVAFVLLLAVDPVLTIVVFVPVLLVVGAVWVLGARIKRYRVAARETTEAVTGFLGESFGAAGAIKVAGAELPLLARFATLNDRRRHMMVRDRTLTAATDALVNNTADVAIGIVLLLAAGTIGGGGGEQGLSVGDIALFTVLLGRISFGAYMAGQFLARVKQASVSVERIVDLLPGATTADLFVHRALEEPLPAVAAEAVTNRDDAPLLELRGITCRYDTDTTEPIDGVEGTAGAGGTGGIIDVDLVVERGQLVVVTGQVGAGKTTLLRAALGLLPLQAGEVRWQGQALQDPSAVLGPPHTAYTPQVPRLFSMDLRDNLTMGLDAGDEHVLAAMRDATLDVDLAAMPHGLETMVGPRGLRLSGGQIQRSAAARMLVRQPELLVFDDLSSALDVETEAQLWDRLFSRDEPTTALVVSHRRPALARADLVVVLDEGRVVARGTADELRTTSPVFRELWG
jgi:ATP-binding cassette, subfamily B, bacterial